MFLALLGACVWDATRFEGEPWFRWLLPVGCLLLLLGIFTLSLALMIIAVIIGAIGLMLTNRWRWSRLY
jgi:hypothetical protein